MRESATPPVDGSAMEPPVTPPDPVAASEQPFAGASASDEVTASSASPHGCRFCGTGLEHLVVDLGAQPLCESYVKPERYWAMEPFWVVRAYVCAECLLVQVPELVAGEEIYSDYAYFSSYSDSWLAHARRYAEAAVERFGLDEGSRVVEIASNDGYLLHDFVERGIPCLGVEPAANVAEAALARGVPTLVEFFGLETARDVVADGGAADLVIANNVIGHVPAINDFVAGLKALLAPGGTITIEIPHFLRTFEGNQFDQVYQEHYSYWSLLAMERVLAEHGLVVHDVDEIATHGGSLRFYARHEDDDTRPVSAAVERVRAEEIAAGFDDPATYTTWNERVKETKRQFVEFVIGAARRGESVAGYGAPGKGNTLLNYCGVREDLLEYTVDRNPVKQGTFLPGTRIPVHPPERLAETRPDWIVLLPWNLEEELLDQLAYAREWGARFLVPIPEPRVVP